MLSHVVLYSVTLSKKIWIHNFPVLPALYFGLTLDDIKRIYGQKEHSSDNHNDLTQAAGR